MNLQRVRTGFVVVLPESWWHQSDEIVRAREGDIIDVGAPGEGELLKGQLHKLEPAPKDSVPTPAAIAHPRIARVLREAAAKAGVSQPSAAPVEQPSPAAPPPPIKHPRASSQPALPTVDPLPRVPTKS